MSIKKIYFLALTANKIFFSKKYKNIIGLGEWCNFKKKDLNLMGTPYRDDVTIKNITTYIESLYEKVLNILASELNHTHNKNYDLKAWRIILGPWLMPYLSATYDRYLHIEKAKKNFPKFKTILLSENSYIIPIDTIDFRRRIEGDVYNLQLYSKIFKELGMKFPEKEIYQSNNLFLSYFFKSKIIYLINYLSLMTFRCITFFSKKSGILVQSSYFPKKIDFYLTICNLGKLVFYYQAPLNSLHFPIKSSLTKKRLTRVNIGKSEYEIILSKIIFSDIPLSFLENFEYIENTSKKIYPSNIGAIFSSIAWYFDENFKQYSAYKYSSKNFLLFGSQHGGNYGSTFNSQYITKHELEICDRYYSWGWTNIKYKEKIIPFYANKIVGITKKNIENKHGILWVGTHQSRFLYDFSILPINFVDYLKRQEIFLNNISDRCLLNIKYRAHFSDGGWGISSRLKKVNSKLQFSNLKVSFHEALKNCRIYVVDHLSTTFLEALSLNKPTIIFTSDDIIESAKPFYQLLRDVGILFESPEEAAIQLNIVYDNADTWWLDKKRQKNIKIFTGQFSKNSEHSFSGWNNEFKFLHKLINS